MQEETWIYASNLMGFCLKQEKRKTTLQGEPHLTFFELVEDMILIYDQKWWEGLQEYKELGK